MVTSTWRTTGNWERRHESARLRGMAILVLLTLAGASRAEQFVVDSILDEPDANPGDGICASAGGHCTLRAAIMEANALPSSDTIVLSSGTTYFITIPGADSGIGQVDPSVGDLDIVDNLVIQGNGANIGSQTPCRVFDIQGNASHSFTVAMFDVNIGFGNVQGDPLGFGGGLNARGCVVNLVRCRIQNNQSDANGGGIAISGILFPAPVPGSLTLTDCAVAANSGRNGGGLYCSNARITMTGCTVTGNTSLGNLGGAGVFTTGAVSAVDITDSTLEQNSSSQGGGAVYVASGHLAVQGGTLGSNTAVVDGGGIYSGLFIPTADTELISVDIYDNAADGSGGGSGRGGGLFNRNGVVTAQLCRFFTNSAVAGTGIYDESTSVTAINNWWGCNEGPAAASGGCDGVGPGVAADPWIVLNLQVAPTSIGVNSQSTLTASLTRNSDGEDITSLGSVPSGIPVAFQASPGGSITAADATVDGGTAQATLTAGPASASVLVRASVDNARVASSVSIVDLVCDLSPSSIIQAVGGDYAAALSLTLNGFPVPGASVTFRVVTGPNAGIEAMQTTNAQGMATFGFASNGVTGTDTVEADGTVDGVPFHCSAVVNWVPLQDTLNGWVLYSSR